MFKTGLPTVIPDTKNDPRFQALSLELEGMNAEMAIPLLGLRGEIQGVLNFEHPEKRHFRQEDVYVAQLFASRIVFVSRLSALYTNLNDQINPRIAFGRIAARLQDEGWDLMRSLRLLLVGVTAGESLGFRRALLFLLDEDRGTLRGALAVGSLTNIEAVETWDKYRNERERVPFPDRLERLLTDVEENHEAIRSGKEREAKLAAAVQRLAFRRNEVRGLLRECLEKASAETCRGESLSSDWLGNALRATTPGDFGVRPFWAVPVVAGGEPIGVLVVDHSFLEGREDAEPPDKKKRTLEAFAELTALCVETSRLRARVQTQTYEALFHQIKSPVNNAGTLLREYLQDKSPEFEPRQLRLALAELKKAQWVAGSVKVFADIRLKKDLRAGMELASLARQQKVG